jgi:cytoskeletal protein CcmA (bactofilin family)
LTDVQEAVAESTPIEAAQDQKRDGQRKFTMGPNDSLEGKLTYDGSVHVDGRAEGELRVTGNIEVASGAKVKAFLEASNVTIKGDVEGATNVRDKLFLGKGAKLAGDITARRLQIEDGASMNGHVRMGDFEHQGSGG